jgi:hypothetical protein
MRDRDRVFSSPRFGFCVLGAPMHLQCIQEGCPIVFLSFQWSLVAAAGELLAVGINNVSGMVIYFGLCLSKSKLSIYCA